MADQGTYRQIRFEVPTGATDVVLIRHGESAPFDPDRPFPLTGGHGDPELAEHGRAQAAALAERLASWPISAIYVTSLRRTVETAAPLATRLGLEPRVEADLREVHLGEWEGGLMRHHAARGHPAIDELRRTGRWDVIPGAEPHDAFCSRIQQGLDRIVGAHPDQMVAVICHGGVIGQLLALAIGAHDRSFSTVDNASVSRLVAAGDDRVLRSFNDISHLDHL